MDGESGEIPARSNVVSITTFKKQHIDTDEPTVEARAYVDLWSNGRVRYGLVGASEWNALSLLKPMLTIGQELVLMAAEH